MKAKSLSPDKRSFNLLVSFFKVACAYAYRRSSAEFYFPLALASCVAEGSSRQESDESSALHSKCLASKAILPESISLMIILGFRKVAPESGFSRNLEPICSVIHFLLQIIHWNFQIFTIMNRSFRRSFCLQFSFRFQSSPKLNWTLSDIIKMCSTTVFNLNEIFKDLIIFRVINNRVLKMNLLQKLQFFCTVK